GVISHYNVQPVLDVLAAADRADLWSVSSAVQRIVDEIRPTLPRGTFITIRGQAETMRSSFTALAGGMVLAVVLVYLLMVVNFQSWLDPFIILMALPGAMAGVLWMLFVTQTNISIPALMGAIMCVGVATSNSILVVQFANEQREEKKLDAHDAALAAGTTRLRPVIMTALAMILGMLPMSLGLGEGGEQNAPLGRVVIGGLTLATFAVLFIVGVVPRLVLRHRLRTDADTARTRLPLVSTANPRHAPEVLEVPLPGSMEAILETGIWARTDGYLTARYVDIGDRVR